MCGLQMRWAVGKGVFGHNNKININCCGLPEVKALYMTLWTLYQQATSIDIESILHRFTDINITVLEVESYQLTIFFSIVTSVILEHIYALKLLISKTSSMKILSRLQE